MAIRYYILPTTATVVNGRTIRVPQYLDAAGVTSRSSIYFGDRPRCICAADVTNGQHTSLMANADVLAAPANLDNVLTAQVANTAQTQLEALNIPAQWIAAGLTWRQVVKRLAGMFDFCQRVQGRHQLLNGVGLNDTVGDIPQGVRQALADAADDLGLDRSDITLATTIREALRLMGLRRSAATIFLRGEL